MNDFLSKYISKDHAIVIVTAICIAIPIWLTISNNIYSTKLEVSQLKNEVLQQKIQLMEYSDNGDKIIMDRLDAKYEKILQKLDHLK